MCRTTEGVTRPTAVVSRSVALILVLAMFGCADSGGLRSVWSDRPSLLNLWDRKPQPSPDPANDYYTRYMRAARSRTGAAAKSSRDDEADPDRSDESGPPGPDDEPVAGNDRDEAIRVTLGRPEPLPPLPPDATLASAAPSPSRVIDRSPPPPLSRRDDDRSEAEKEEAAPPTATSPRRSPPPAANRARRAAVDAREILAQSEAKLRSLDTYQVKMSRIERVDGRLQPEEEFLLSIHREPKEVRLEWASGPSQGREVIYSARIDPKSLFVHMPRGAIALPTMKMAIDSPMVTRSSRHSITEAGFDTIINNLRQSVDQVDAENAARGRAAHRGIEKPPGLDRPSHVFTRHSPNGETWTVFIDARSLLPSMVVAKNAAGELDEKYVYHEVVENPAALASADAFDPDRRWGAANGLFSRFSRGGSDASSPGNGQSTRK